MKKYLVIVLFICCYNISVAETMRSKNPQQISVEASVNDSIKGMLDEYNRIQLPPLSVFLASAENHPSALIYSAKVEEQQAEYDIVKYSWLDYIRAVANYQYGYNNSMTNYYNPDDPIVYDKNNRAESRYTVGASISIPIGDLVTQKYKRRKQKAILDQLKYEYDITLEERKLTILKAYNEVIEQLSTIKVKAEAAALYNAQMKISEDDFINGKISIISLSLERGRRSSAMSLYQESRVSLHNAITLLEMLTNVTIMRK